MARPAAVDIYTPLRALPVRVRFASRLTDDELFDLCARNRKLRIERTKDGEIIVMSPTGGETGRRNFALTTQFGLWVARDGSGIGFDSSTGFILPNGAERSPDVGWVRRERWDALTPVQRRKFPPLCPDLVIELLSPSDDLVELQAKMVEWIANGVKLGWLIDGDARRVEAHRRGRPVEILQAPGRLVGDPEFPGLVLDMTDVW